MSARVIWIGCLLAALGCERDPPIVIRFDLVDLGGRDLARLRDLASTVDAATSAGSVATPTKPSESMTCAADVDCVVVPDGCCDCANGGKQRVVPRRQEAKLRSARQQACKDTMCTMMVSTDRSCGKRAACVDHACVMRDARPGELRGGPPR